MFTYKYLSSRTVLFNVIPAKHISFFFYIQEQLGISFTMFFRVAFMMIKNSDKFDRRHRGESNKITASSDFIPLQTYALSNLFNP